MRYPSISIEIICKNEEKVISRCLQAIEKQLGLEDEVIVVDTGSTDRTVSIIKDGFPNVKVASYQWEDDFSKARNFGIALSKNEWIFFIDSDEILQPMGLEKLRQSILKVEDIYNKPVVFCPKVLNTDDTIDYNAGRVIKNNGNFKFYGCVHEYPVYLNDLNATNYMTIKLPEVVMIHDGYKEETVNEKNKPLRNSTLNQKMREEFPNSARYYYFYFRDAKPLISQEEYEIGLKKFFDRFPHSSYMSQVYIDLITHLISKSKTDEADLYLRKYWDDIKSKEDVSRVNIIYLTVLNELRKISITQQDLLQTLESAKASLEKDENRTIENGYMLDDAIGFLIWSLGDCNYAKRLHKQLENNGYHGMLNQLFSIEKQKVG